VRSKKHDLQELWSDSQTGGGNFKHAATPLKSTKSLTGLAGPTGEFGEFVEFVLALPSLGIRRLELRLLKNYLDPNKLHKLPKLPLQSAAQIPAHTLSSGANTHHSARPVPPRSDKRLYCWVVPLCPSEAALAA
jgi:hypothetical protein